MKTRLRAVLGLGREEESSFFSLSKFIVFRRFNMFCSSSFNSIPKDAYF
jgi:hypothetical protein